MMDPLSICFAACSVMGFLSVYRVWKDKKVCGVSVLPPFVYGTTNLFEVFYFSMQVERGWTAVGAFLMFASNAVWLFLVFFYRSRDKAFLKLLNESAGLA